MFFLFTFSTSIFASTQDEIDYLFNFISTTDCKFERNGKMYNGLVAVEHIKKKYKHYFDSINTTESFIRYSATKSLMSGEYYKIHCQNETAIKSQEWLLKELAAYRKE